MSVAGASAAEDAAADSASLVAPRAEADSLAADSLARRLGVEIVGGSSRARPASGAARSPGRFSAPGWVMARSAVVPGWGQLTNGSWLKALAIAGIQGTLGSRLADDFRALDRLQREVDAAQADPDESREESAVLAYNARLDESIRRQWLMAGVLAYSLLDAYVDAHFKDFDLQFEPEPARPDGDSSLSARLSLRWSF